MAILFLFLTSNFILILFSETTSSLNPMVNTLPLNCVVVSLPFEESPIESLLPLLSPVEPDSLEPSDDEPSLEPTFSSLIFSICSSSVPFPSDVFSLVFLK